jgi:hypothetical protein
MALVPKALLSLTNKCNKVTITDTTGIYDSLGNTGGWGSPNLETISVINALVKISHYSTPGTVLTTYDVTSAVSSYSGSGQVFTIALEQTWTLPDDVYYIKYQVSDGTNTYIGESFQLFICNLYNCKDNLVMKLLDACSSLEVTKLKEQVDQMEMFIYGIEQAFEIGDYANVEHIIEAAQKYCQVVTECKSC